MIKGRLLQLLVVLTVSVFVAGCEGSGRTQKVYNVVDSPTTAKPGLSVADVSNAIIRGGQQRGWVIKKVSDGQLEGTLRVRTHVAVVDITHDTQTFSIKYKSSVHLLYSNEGGTEYIHRNYNSWVRFLESDIKLAVGLVR